MFILTDSGERAFLTAIVGTYTNMQLHLFKNNYTPVEGSTVANFTEADFGGYAAVSLSNAVQTVDHVAWDAITWTRTGTPTNTIYGAYVTDNGGTVLYWTKTITPVTLSANGQ